MEAMKASGRYQSNKRTLGLRRRPSKPERPKRQIPALETDPTRGLTVDQVRLRVECGATNAPVEPPTKTTKQIILTNVFTYFNILFFLLAACVAYVRSWQNMMFLGVVFVNTLLGIYQELRAKKTLDGLSILTAPKSRAIRNGRTVLLETSALVRDDIVLFAAGDQICADAVVAEGGCTVNEALVTGEADEIRKEPGDTLLSGSYVVNGECRARLTAVGADSFVAGLTQEAKRSKAVGKTGIMRDLSRLVKWIGFAILPLGVLMFCKEHLWLDRELAISVTSTVGSIIGMIPEGLYLLTSLALMTGVVRLAKRRTLVHDMGCIETLARVDTLCVDKTGTITESGMTAEGLVPLCPERYPEEKAAALLADYAAAMRADNETMAALQRAYPGGRERTACAALPFSSARKYGGVSFGGGETYLLGAPEILLAQDAEGNAEILERAGSYAAAGNRVLLLGVYGGSLADGRLSAPVEPVALVLLANRIRPEAPATFAYFRDQGVRVKVISGDNPQTAASAATRAGIPNADQWVDARTLDTPAALREAAECCTVFGRVTPERKRELVEAMKQAGHTVAMTGDGVNDVLALKTADCSIAMASGSDVACQVSQVVLLDSDFSAMPSVVQEGRRVINNIERSASLYLVKNIFSFCLALITLFFALPYPFSPTQISLVSALTIGIPSFVLAMEPNHRRIEGKFLPNVIYRAVPAAFADVVMVVTVILFYLSFDLTEGALSTICTCIMGVVGLLMVNKTCQPYTPVRRALIVLMCVGFLGSVLFLGDLFTLSDLSKPDLLVLVVVALLGKPVFDEFSLLLDMGKRSFARLRLRLRAKGRLPAGPEQALPAGEEHPE